MTRGDKVLIGGVLIMALILLGVGYVQKNAQHNSGIAVIRAEGQIVREVELYLKENQELRIEGPLGTSVARIVEGRVQMVSSPCRDKICIKQGQISRSGQSIVCVPNEVSITIEAKGEVDEITR